MPYNRLSTSKIAKIVGCHPNTVRIYEQWGFLPPVPRSQNGYRLFSEAHLDQMRLARTAFGRDWPGKPIRRSALALVRQSASGDLGGALESGYKHLALVQSEIAQADAAAGYLQRWAEGTATTPDGQSYSIAQAALLLGLTIDTLRGWDRSGLIDVPRNASGYRQYGPAEIGRLRVIRMLRSAGYSTMAILRMLLELDKWGPGDLRRLLDTPRPDEDALFAADRWLSTLADQEERARSIIAILEEMIARQPKPSNRSPG